jgi:hypothetical protein
LETIFIEGALPQGFRCDFDPYLFNVPANLTLQSLEGWRSFYAIRNEKKVVRAQVHFHVQDDVAQSPYRNPFGSFEFSDSMIPKELFEFIRWTEAQLKEKGVRSIEIKSYPQCYHASRSSILTTFLFNLGYRVKDAELSACIKVNANSLYQQMTSWEKRKLGQLKKTSLRFAQIPSARFKEVHDFISSCREERKQTLSMSYPQIKSVCDVFPDKFCLFGVYDSNALAAASISILVNKTILYNFYSAHARQYDPLSPVVKLMEGIYGYCQGEKIELIDLGTSSLHGKPNFSLLDFKLHLGAMPTQKLTFEKTLS